MSTGEVGFALMMLGIWSVVFHNPYRLLVLFLAHLFDVLGVPLHP